MDAPVVFAAQRCKSRYYPAARVLDGVAAPVPAPAPHEVQPGHLRVGDGRVEVLSRDPEAEDEPLQDELHQERTLEVVRRLAVRGDELGEAVDCVEAGGEVLAEGRLFGGRASVRSGSV
ncbi:MAG: hypothetical protein IPP07_23845 [Holophagales bacterium]|nr:hypothetical protein [Holophagales bacterium]